MFAQGGKSCRVYAEAGAGRMANRPEHPDRIVVETQAGVAHHDRYFAEFNFGYNGSERFDKNHRFGFFPSGGIAWTVSNEKFWERYVKVINNLKIRATYRLVGNDQIDNLKDRFFYL